jgi:hypothetical protein
MQFIVNLQSFRVEAKDEIDAQIKAEEMLAVESLLPLIESIEITEDEKGVGGG